MLDRKLFAAAVVGIVSVGLFSAVALGAFSQETAGGATTLPAAPAAESEAKADRLKALLDGLVQKGVITQQQEDAILAAAKDAFAKRKDHPAANAVRHDFFEAAAQYLGIGAKDLHAKLAGTSLGAIADATAGKSRAALVAALTAAANADLDKALAGKRISEEQAKKLRTGLPEHVAKFVDRKWPAAKPAAPRQPNVKSFLGDLVQSGQAYLGLSLADIRAQLTSGKSLAEIAVGAGKSRDGLVAALTTVVNTRIDEAVANRKLTAEQAATLKAKVTAEIGAFVDRKLTTHPKAITAKP